MNQRNALSIFAMILSLATHNAYADDGMSSLMAMAKKMADAKQYSVSIKMSYDVVQESGQKIEFSEVRKLTVKRPDHLRVDTHKSNGKKSGLIYDGKRITLFSKSENVYSRTDQAGDLDAMIRYAVGKMGMRIPLARMLTTKFPQELQKLSKETNYVEQNTLGKIPVDHIAGRSENVDYQVWIAKDNLPRRIILTYKNAPGQPQFQADFSEWNLKPKIPDTTFVFKPPKGAEKIPTLLPAAVTTADKKTSGGAQ